MKTRTLNGSHRNGNAAELPPIARPQPLECNAAAAVTTLALGYKAELERRVRLKALPYGIGQYMQERAAEVEAQARELGTPAHVSA